MAEEHENRPNIRRRRAYRQEVILGSASSWTKFNLDLFRVDYDKAVYEPLPTEVHDCAAQEKDPEFEKRTT